MFALAEAKIACGSAVAARMISAVKAARTDNLTAAPFF
jgi:hypothetical protein